MNLLLWLEIQDPPQKLSPAIAVVKCKGCVQKCSAVEHASTSNQMEKCQKVLDQEPSVSKMSQKKNKERLVVNHGDVDLSTPILSSLMNYVLFGCCATFGAIFYSLKSAGILNDGKPLDPRREENYSTLYSSFESFFTRTFFDPVRNIFERVTTGVPGAHITIKGRASKSNLRNFPHECINMGSYNYLGFSDNKGQWITPVKESIAKLGLGNCSSRRELGFNGQLERLESLVAQYLGTEAALTYGMGFATNSTTIPALVSKGDLVISDEKNHASIILGVQISGASVEVFKHNNVVDLERVLRRSIIQGQPRTRRPWKKILIIVEGIYSMEGTIVKLPEIIALKKKYKAYLYLDEAHSIGACGSHGKGVVDYFGLDVRDVDIMMGTFTKSFGASGGYIAGSKALIDYLRTGSHGWCYATSMSPPIAQQIISTTRIIQGEDMHDEGKRRIRLLLANSRYFRRRLKQEGFQVLGDDDSPVVPILIACCVKVIPFVKILNDFGVATVGVSFPATSIQQTRSRFCVSAAHTKEMLDDTIDAIIKAADVIHLHRQKRRVEEKVEIFYEYSDDLQ
ncbi:unnamed protein product [Cyprideis torosa]|uniref:serine C-palmitoyltransferase n=1 Tax=Cyprideis torosa TaxID=163714 RepID=A0A7R8WG23_9CRUS|nr:unnamed protein product [Cyprideis torosa]CAG0894815.1 unnamed protein product [Cyprideis torosa]